MAIETWKQCRSDHIVMMSSLGLHEIKWEQQSWQGIRCVILARQSCSTVEWWSVMISGIRCLNWKLNWMVKFGRIPRLCLGSRHQKVYSRRIIHITARVSSSKVCHLERRIESLSIMSTIHRLLIGNYPSQTAKSGCWYAGGRTREDNSEGWRKNAFRAVTFHEVLYLFTSEAMEQA